MSDVSLSPEYLNTIRVLCEQIEYENQIYGNFHKSELGPVDIPAMTEEDYESFSSIPEVSNNLSDIESVSA